MSVVKPSDASDSPVLEKHGAIDTTINVSQAATDLEKIKHAHQFDPNLPQDKLDFIDKALHDGDADEIIEADALFTEDSPYEEVRAAVRNTDGGEVANTVRAWILGMLFVTIGSGLNMFLSMRSPAINFPSLVVQLLVYPIGCFWAKVVPTRVFNTFGMKWTFNTGPFTIKEHVVVTLMSNVSIGYAYSTDALLALQGKPFYNINLGWGFQILFTLSSQLIGIALAGLSRRFLVWPAAMICMHIRGLQGTLFPEEFQSPIWTAVEVLTSDQGPTNSVAPPSFLHFTTRAKVTERTATVGPSVVTGTSSMCSSPCSATIGRSVSWTCSSCGVTYSCNQDPRRPLARTLRLCLRHLDSAQ